MLWIKRWFRERSGTVRSNSHTSTSLRLEELEPRWVPSSSTNWSGYAVSSAPNSVTAVSGSWTVPTVKGTGSAYSSAWVGIDGYTSSTVEQTGTESDLVNGVAQYSAWFEMYPNAEVTIPLAIHPGDKMSASVTYANDAFTLTIQDLSDSGTKALTVNAFAASAQRSSAEWIAESPSSNIGVLPLANFAALTFTNAQATISGVTGPINNSPWASEVQAIRMVSTANTLETSPSALLAGGTSFSVIDDLPTNTPVIITPSPTRPNPGSTDVTTTLIGTVNPNSSKPAVTVTAVVSSSVPVGSEVELLSGGGVVLDMGTVQNVHGSEEVTFTVTFLENGTFTFYADLLGPGQKLVSTSNTLTVTVTSA